MFKHNTHEVYVNTLYWNSFGLISVQSCQDRELKNKWITEMPDLKNFHAIEEQEYRRWRIHEVWYDGDIKLPQATIKNS